jgi:hypothetical protein
MVEQLLQSMLRFLYSRIGTNILTKDVIVNDHGPRIVAVKEDRKTRGNLADHGQSESDARKVVMFIVVSDTLKAISKPTVAVGLLALFENVMFRDEMSSDGMQAYRAR